MNVQTEATSAGMKPLRSEEEKQVLRATMRFTSDLSAHECWMAVELDAAAEEFKIFNGLNARDAIQLDTGFLKDSTVNCRCTPLPP